MDSRKFKKLDRETPKLKHKKRKPKLNYRNILKILVLLAIIAATFSLVPILINNSLLPDNTEMIHPREFNMTPYGYDWNKDLYGYCVATDSNQSESRYYFTLNQMAALADHSDNTFNYTEGIYVNYTYDEKNKVKIVDKIYDKNKKEIVLSRHYDEYSFLQNARFIGKDSPYCVDDFGFTPEEYADSVFYNTV